MLTKSQIDFLPKFLGVIGFENQEEFTQLFLFILQY